ncbi:hypothetical protein MM239_20715 [Belliella sp. DSM 111904]|uniref:DUF4369 domain-containing protein n=1 Tax=Belliella filtrata TaxID=2923435 RepID=A0ABS9V5W4_9BACT|nr:hypothetical protein [Belliella filtrata]MCH7411821.1 hypothetical protein [Belliella filtrata]
MKILELDNNIKILGVCLLWLCSLTSRAQDSVMTESVDSAPVVIYGEIKSSMPVEELTLTVQTHYLTPNGKFPSPIKVNAKTESGNLFTGTLGFETFYFSTEPIDEIAVISIFHARGFLIQDYKVIPGDTVRINADFTMLRTSFSGPAAESFIFQSQAKIINASNDLNQPNAIVTPNADGLIERFSEAYQSAKDDPVRPVMTILDSNQATLKYLIEWVSKLTTAVDSDEYLQNSKKQVDEKILHGVLADRLGLERYKILDHFNRIYDGSDAHNAFYHQILKDLDSTAIPSINFQVDC